MVTADGAYKIYKALVSIEIVFGLLANFFVMAAVACSRKMRASPMNLLIANLALADFLLLLFIALDYSYPYIMHTRSNGLMVSAAWVCVAYDFIPNTFWTATVTTFVTIAVER